MKKASGIMYTIGKVINIIEIVCNAILVLFGALIIANKEDLFAELIKDPANNITSVSQVNSIGLTLLIAGIVACVISIVILILAIKAKKAISQNKKGITPHIVMIVVGVFGDIFYLLGGIFGLVATTQQEQHNNN